MDLRETTELMDVLITAYPNMYSRHTNEEKKRAIKIWQEMFAQDDARVVAMAVKSIIAGSSNSYPPTIGQVKAQMRSFSPSAELTEQQAWNEVRRAVSNGNYGSVEEFERLSPIVQKAVGSHESIKEWAMSSIDELETVIASNFMRTYRGVATRQRDYDNLPDDIKMILADIGKARLE